MSESRGAGLVKAGRTPAEVGVVDVPAPVAGRGEVVLEVLGCGLCGSDVHAWRGDDGYDWVRTPVVLGHEVVGRVARVGAGVDASLVGRLVVPVAIDGCGTCPTCAAGSRQLCPERTVLGLSFDGGIAREMVIAAERLVPVPAGIPPLRAVLTEPMSVAHHAVDLLGDVAGRGRIVVSGPGPIGLFAAWLLHRRGADVVVTGIEPDARVRLPAAEALGLRTVRTDLEGDLGSPVGWIEASGSGAALGGALAALPASARCVVVALFGRQPTVDINQMVRKEVQVVGSYSSVRADYLAALEAMRDADGLEDVVVTAFALPDAVAGLEATAAGNVVKAVVEP